MSAQLEYFITPRVPGVRPKDPPDYDGYVFVYVFTQILDPWITPPVMGNVVVVVANSQGFVPGMTIAIQDAGYYEVVSTEALDRMTIKNLYSSNAPPGTPIGPVPITTTSLPGPAGPAGPVGPNGAAGPTGQGYTWRGNWLSGTTYQAYDSVSRGGSSYVAVATSTAVDPTTDGGAKWQLLAQVGSPGPAGPGTGDMLKSVYDPANNGFVNHAGVADTVLWSGISGKPTTFPPDSTAMLKSVYDPAEDGVVDHAALADTATAANAAPWTGITGKPATFPPDSTAMLKSVYDANGDNIVDHAALADTAPWTGISGKPATFPPDSTAMLKSVYDANSDNIVDHAALADAAPWLGITGRPATFPPDGTAMLKSVYDTNADNIVDHAALADTAPWSGISTKLTLEAGTITASFTCPGFYAAVAGVAISSSPWLNVGDKLYIQTAGKFIVAAKASNISITLLNTGDAGNASSGTIASGVPFMLTEKEIGESILAPFVDDFIDGTSPGFHYFSSQIGTGGAATGFSNNWAEPDHRGVGFITNGTTVASYAWFTGSSSFLLQNSGVVAWRAVIFPGPKPTTTAAALANLWIGLGTQANAAALPADFVGFTFQPSVDANNWRFTTRKAGVETDTVTSFPYTANAWVDMSFIVDGNGARWRIFAWNGTFPAPSAAVNTNIPTADIGLLFSMYAGAACTTSYTNFIDLWELPSLQPALGIRFRGMNLINNF